MTLSPAFKHLLWRYTGQAEIVIGTPTANRNHPDLEGLIGFFANTLVLRTRVSGEASFAALLQDVREVCVGAYAHQDIPFEKLVEELQPERSLSHNPIFQVLFALQNAPMQAMNLEGLRLERVPVYTGTSMFDMSWFAIEVPEGLLLRAEYNTDLFDDDTISRALLHFQTLLEAVVAHPVGRISELPLLTAAEKNKLLLEFNDTAVEYPTNDSLHSFFETQAERTPDAIALVCEGQQLTYRQLNERANQLAHHLRGLGIKPDDLVGICAHRSVEMVVGLYGIMKAGGAYVPLDPDYPRDRVAMMIEDAQPKVLLTQERLLETLPDYSGNVICLDRDWQRIAIHAVGNPTHFPGGENLAYAIYTSGSTGKPKGVPNVHKAIVNRLLWMQARYGLTPADRVLQKTPYSFDVSVWEFFWPLLAGARLVMARPGGHQDPAYLVRTIQDEGITTLHFVPSMLQVFLEAPGLEECSSLRRVVCSGEALPPDLQRRFFARLPEVELHNLYGPTEAAVDVTSWACEREDRRGVVPIGRPVANTQIHLLGPAGERVPVGVAGELHIGGVQVCRGYWARPELTAEKFVPDPFAGEPGSRLYRTGDLARYLPDGAIDFLGRLDHQVKVRGLRIELGEIESALTRHPAVREAVVVARAAGSAVGAVNLVAYVTLLPESAAPSLEELRQDLGKSLPEHMLPSALVTLESLPLTASGKVDRKALPAPERMAEGARERVAPRTPLERSLAGLWSEVLGIAGESIGVEDSFFQIGGNSITGAILINRLQQELGEIVHVVTIFDAPTIARLAAYLLREYPGSIARLGGEAGAWTAIERRPIEPDRPLPLSFAQERLWFLEQLDPGKPTYNIPITLRLEGSLA